MFVGVEHLLAAANRDTDRDDLFGQDAVLLCRHGACMRSHRELVLFDAADAVPAAQILGSFDHAAGHRVVPATCRGPRADEAVVHLDARSRGAPAHVDRVERCVAHRFGATGDHEFVVAVAHLESSLDDGLQT